ncbi:class D sortase [Peribacillus sp. B-H-3]|uniref:class D sortase n=1 Tax=Peribacillus sp. B-H-3 TaxID=3400420 RepID=UPI003B01587E
MKKKGLLIAALLLIVLGIAFTSTNAYTFAKGYFLYKLDSKDEPVSKPSAAPAASVKQDAPPELYPVRPKQGEEMGTLYIPKLKASLPIYHGTDEDELKKGVGHYAKSVLPGENDNSVLSGHRDTVFRRLGEVGVGDLLTVKTSAGKFTYKVRKVRIVDKNDRTVIVPKPRATLTVSTCYPFSYIGSAPQRYILIAYLLHN